MAALTESLFLISNGLLIPVIIILLALFLKALLLLGGFYALAVQRARRGSIVKSIIISLEGASPSKDEASVSPFTPTQATAKDAFYQALAPLCEPHTPALKRERALSDYELIGERDLEHSRLLTRLSPMFGLMGTLIPMAPALAGLATGDLGSMAQNMQVAFATTVVGLVAGAIGYFSHTLKQRWFREDMRTLEYINALNEQRTQMTQNR
jgi:biopolymer transport protein ExbB/TolQ